MPIVLSWMGASRQANDPSTVGITNSDVTTYMGDTTSYMSFLSGSTYNFYSSLLTGSWPDNSTRPILDKVLSGTGKKLIAQLPETAMDEYCDSDDSYIDDIESNYGSNSGIEAWYLEEPDEHTSWTPTKVSNLKGILSYPLIVNLQENACQSEVNSYSAAGDYVSMPSYPLANGTAEFANIEAIAESSGTENAIYKMVNASGSPDYYFVVQACNPNVGADREPITSGSGSAARSAEIDWMAHRALVADRTPSGLFFFDAVTAESQNTDLLYAVDNLCNDLTNPTASVVDILPTAEQNSDVTVNSGGSDILFAYREVSGKHYLMVIDKKPETSGSRSFQVTCDIGSQYAEFDSVLEVYSGNEVTGSTKVSPSSVSFSDSLNRGQCKFYRFLEI